MALAALTDVITSPTLARFFRVAHIFHIDDGA